MSQQNFYEKYAQLAIDQQIKYGIPASITLQQMALESGHGKSDLAANYNNYFGVKAGSSWKGPTVMKVDDHNYPEAFRVYGSVEESVENHSKVLMASRYRNCFNYSSTDYQNCATAYSISETALKEYKEKAVEVVGEKKEQAIRDAVAKETLMKHPLGEREVIITGGGDILCFDPLTNRYFKSDRDRLMRAMNELNKRMRDEMRVSLNDFYDEIGLSEAEVGEHLGWDIDNGKGYIDLDFSTQLADDGTPCLVVGHNHPPIYLW